MKYNGYHGYSAQALIALQITLECAHVVKLKKAITTIVG